MPTGVSTGDQGAVAAFLAACSHALTRASVDPASRAGARVFADALARSTATPDAYEPGWLPALDTVDRLDPESENPLAPRFAAAASLLPWIPSPRSDDGGATMALSPIDQTRDFGGITVGMMYLAPGVQYPLHSHPPQELYLTVAGTARWRYGGHDGLRTVGPGRAVYNHPDDLHTAIAGDRPLVALYVLWP